MKAKTLRPLLPAARSSKSAGKASNKAIDSSFKTNIVSCLLTENAAENSETQLSGDVASSVDSKGSSNVSAVDPYDSDEGYNLSSENNICGVKLTFTPMDARNRSISREQKNAYHERKQRWIFRNSQGVKFRKLIKYCGTTLGICVYEALKSEDEKDFLEQFYRACELFMSMKEHALQLDEETYGPALMLLIDMHGVDEFFFLIDIIKDVNSSMNSRLGYYEMLFAIEVNDDNKIRELSGQIASDGSDCLSILQDQMSDNISVLLACYATSTTNLTVLGGSNPLRYTGKPRLGTVIELLRVTDYLSNSLSEVSIPFIVLHGDDDVVTDPEVSRALYKESKSQDKTLKIYPGMLHSLLFGETDENIQKVRGDVLAWLNERCVKQANCREG